MMTTLRATFLILVSTLCIGLRAQDGTLDPTFNPDDLGYGSGTGASYNSMIYSTMVRPDGKVVATGTFTSFHQSGADRIVQLNSDGSVDFGFNPGSGANGAINSSVLLPDGKVLIAGAFTSFNGSVRNRIARILIDGSLDASFDPGAGADAAINTITVQSDDKVVIAGDFTMVGGTTRNRIARLNVDGSLDLSFDPGSGANASVYNVIIQPDGKILACGALTTFNGATCNRIVRLETNGTVDASFTSGTGTNHWLRCMTLQPDGKILVGGHFTSYNFFPRNRIVRINANGTLDDSFSIGTGLNGIPFSIVRQPDGQFLIGGNFTTYNGTTRSYVARVSGNGTLDASFDPGVPAVGLGVCVYSVSRQSDGKVLVGGRFDRIANVARGSLARLNADGSLDHSFARLTGANDRVYSITTQTDGRMIIAGEFNTYNDVGRDRVARIEADGALDPSFDTGTGANYTVWKTATQSDGKVIIVGSFTTYNGVARNRVARLNVDGSLDMGFLYVSGADGMVNNVLVQPDGKIIFVGSFSAYNGTTRNGIARLNTDGSIDTSFDPGTGCTGGMAVSLQSDGKIIIGGVFTTYNGTTRNRIARLNSNGSLDTTFDPGIGPNDGPWVAAPQADGRILIAGQFTSVNGIPRSYVARLNSDGTLDPGFAPTNTFNEIIYDAVQQPDGKVVVVGGFYFGGADPYQCIARLNMDGSLDNTFDHGYGPSSVLYTVDLHSDGRIMIGGLFDAYDGIGRNRIARLNGTARSNIRVMLEGPYSNGLMSDALRTLTSFPLTEPFTAMGYTETGYSPGATIAPSVLSVTGNNAIVDWVIVEMRPAATPNVVAASRAVLLQRDGEVVDLDGVSTVGFSGLAHGNYCVVVKPRNHLPVMLSPSTPFAYGTSTATVDFTFPATQVYDNDARKNVGGVMLLRAGDVSFNEALLYVGAGNDRDPILVRIGGSTPTATVSGYYPEDVNMDGVVKYVGTGNDRDPILLNIGGTNPTATTQAQLP